MTEKSQFSTDTIHVGYDPQEMLGSLSDPIFQTSTYTFYTAEQGERRFSGEEEGYVYSSLGNLTVSALEVLIAALVRGEWGLAFLFAMEAHLAVLIDLKNAKNHASD